MRGAPEPNVVVGPAGARLRLSRDVGWAYRIPSDGPRPALFRWRRRASRVACMTWWAQRTRAQDAHPATCSWTHAGRSSGRSALKLARFCRTSSHDPMIHPQQVPRSRASNLSALRAIARVLIPWPPTRHRPPLIFQYAATPPDVSGQVPPSALRPRPVLLTSGQGSNGPALLHCLGSRHPRSRREPAGAAEAACAQLSEPPGRASWRDSAARG